MDSSKQIYKYLLKQNHQFVDLITRTRYFSQLQNELFPYVNQYVKNDWALGLCTENMLTIIVKTAEDANRLRFQTDKILTNISKLESFKLLSNIKIKVAPAEFETGAVLRQNDKRISSKVGKRCTESLAKTVSDSALRESLMRLARHLEVN